MGGGSVPHHLVYSTMYGLHTICLFYGIFFCCTFCTFCVAFSSREGEISEKDLGKAPRQGDLQDSLGRGARPAESGGDRYGSRQDAPSGRREYGTALSRHPVRLFFSAVSASRHTCIVHGSFTAEVLLFLSRGMRCSTPGFCSGLFDIPGALPFMVAACLRKSHFLFCLLRLDSVEAIQCVEARQGLPTNCRRVSSTSIIICSFTGAHNFFLVVRETVLRVVMLAAFVFVLVENFFSRLVRCPWTNDCGPKMAFQNDDVPRVARRD